MIHRPLRLIWLVLKDPQYRALSISVLVVLMIGTTFFHFVEGWRWLDALYFSVISLTTVGYGDLVPEKDISKIFVMIYLLTGIGLLLSFVHAITTKRESR